MQEIVDRIKKQIISGHLAKVLALIKLGIRQTNKKETERNSFCSEAKKKKKSSAGLRKEKSKIVKQSMAMKSCHRRPVQILIGCHGNPTKMALACLIVDWVQGDYLTPKVHTFVEGSLV